MFVVIYECVRVRKLIDVCNYDAIWWNDISTDTTEYVRVLLYSYFKIQYSLSNKFVKSST